MVVEVEFFFFFCFEDEKKSLLLFFFLNVRRRFSESFSFFFSLPDGLCATGKERAKERQSREQKGAVQREKETNVEGRRGAKKRSKTSSPPPLLHSRPPFPFESLSLSLSLPSPFSPPSHGVSSGPKITAFQRRMLSAVGEPLTPCGGSCCRRRKSRIRRCGVFFWLLFCEPK